MEVIVIRQPRGKVKEGKRKKKMDGMKRSKRKKGE